MARACLSPAAPDQYQSRQPCRFREKRAHRLIQINSLLVAIGTVFRSANRHAAIERRPDDGGARMTDVS